MKTFIQFIFSYHSFAKKIFFLCSCILLSSVSSAGSNDKESFAPTTTNLVSDNNPSCIGTNITLTATVSPNIATGTIEFFDGATSLGVATITSGTAALTSNSLIAGSHNLAAVYSGDGTYTTSTSSSLTQVVNAGIPATPGSISGISSQCPLLVEQIYSISPLTDAVSYNWVVPTGWIITNGTGTNIISVTTGNTGQNGTISVTATNACGTGAANSLAVTVGNAAPATPGTITGSSGPFCAGITNITYSVALVSNATTYNWSLPTGWIITAGSGTNSITATSGSSGGSIIVTAGNSCGNSAAQTKSVTITPIPATPGTITGTASVCQSATGLVYSIAAVPNATSYTWTAPTGWTISAGAGTVSVTYSTTGVAVSGNIAVAAVNSCGSSAASQTINIVPVNGTDNTGFTDGTTKTSDQLFVANTLSPPLRRGYLKFPLGALSVIPVGSTVTSILKLTNNVSGVSGTANSVTGLGAIDPVSTSAATLFNAVASGSLYNSAGWGSTGLLSLTLLAQANTDIVNSISSPGYIAMGLVKGGTGTAVANFWGFSAGANVPVLSVTYASIRSFAVTVTPVPVAPGTISGPASVCPNSVLNAYSISAVTNATTYTWAVPAGWTITSGQGTLNITATAGLTGGNITVKAGNSCGTSAAGPAFAVTIGQLPTISATPLTQESCSGLPITAITLSNPNAVAGTSYTWTRDNVFNTGMAFAGTAASAITGTLTNLLTTQQISTFTIYAVSGIGCISASPVTATVAVNPNPTANAGVDQFGCAATPVIIGGSPTASGGTSGYTYAWTAGVSNTAIANPTASPGTYTVTVTDSKGCVASDAVTVSNSTGTKTWIGSGTLSGGPDNNFNNPLNWSPTGVPGACNDVIITVDVTSIYNFFSGSLAVTLSASATIKSLAVTVNGTLIFASNTSFTLNVGSNALNILTTTSLNTNPTVIISNPAKGIISVGAGGVVTYGGALTVSAGSTNTSYPFYAAVNNLGKVYVNANATLAGVGNDPANKPARVIFDGTGTQTITNNSGTQPIYLGATSTDIGETNSPTVVLAGTGTLGFRNIGDLNVNNTAVLDLGATQSMNRNSAGGTITLAAGSFMKVGRNTGGVSSSNFPSGFTGFNFNATSTVDYNAAAGQTVNQLPVYGNLTVSSSGSKTPPGNVTAQKNITIQGTAILQGGSNIITLGGNWTSYAQSGFSEGTGTVDFNGAGAQSINTAGGEVFFTLNKTGAGTTTMLSDVAIQGTGSAYNLSNGTFDAGTFSFNSASGTFTISAGLLKLAKTGVTLLPEFAITTYNVTGGTIELYGTGDQVLRGARAYRNLTFSTSGIKTVSSAITSITGTILTQNSVTLDVSNNTMGGSGTNLTMTGPSLYKTAGTGTKPDAQGTYTLNTGTTIEFTNTAGTTEDVRLTAPTYYNVVVSGTNVANSSAGTGIKFQAGGSFTVRNLGLFKVANNTGFSGALTTAIANTNSPSIILENGSTVEYYGGPSGTNAQLITNALDYYHLNFSGISIKTAPSGILTVKGNLSNSGSGFSHNNGTLLLSGVTAQNYYSTGSLLNWYNLTASNPVNVNVINDLNINGLLSLSTAGKLNLVTGSIALKSGAAGTASVDKINIANSISYSDTGRFIAERYIPTGFSHGKTWQFLATPAFGATVNATWQNGQAPLSIGTVGVGTTITSEKAGAVSRGYDFQTTASGPSLKTYNAVTNTWVGIDDGITPTSSLQLANKKGYLIFVRGDRSVQTSATAANATVLVTKGKLYSLGTDAPATITVSANKFESVGNPYASAIDFINLAGTSAGIDTKYYAWDPLLPGSDGYGFGGYQLLSSSNLWKPVPGGTVNYPTGTAYTKIQSGQAFFVYSTTGGTVNFNENNKITGSQMVYRQDNVSDRQFLRAWLYGSTGILADGNVVAFDDAYADDFDADDAIKMQNTTENFAIVHNGKTLALDARNPRNTDTVFYSFNNMHIQSYRLKIAPENMHLPATAFFVDQFNHTNSPLSLTDSTAIDFEITNDPASSAPNRFYVVFRMAGPVPLSIVNITATRKEDESVAVNWYVDGEMNMQTYELERSRNGSGFLWLGSIDPSLNNGGSASYNYTDEHPLEADNFYRVKAVSAGGRIQYSNIAKINATVAVSGISVFPNPVKDNTMQLHFRGQQQGNYKIELISKTGQIVYQGNVSVRADDLNVPVAVDAALSKASYQLRVTAPGNKSYNLQLIIE